MATGSKPRGVDSAAFDEVVRRNRALRSRLTVFVRRVLTVVDIMDLHGECRYERLRPLPEQKSGTEPSEDGRPTKTGHGDHLRRPDDRRRAGPYAAADRRPANSSR